MVFQVVQQVQRQRVNQPTPLRPGVQGGRVAMVVNQPYREKAGQAVPEQHNDQVVTQPVSFGPHGDRPDGHERRGFTDHPPERLPPRLAECMEEHTNRK
jgi:hypothetical protein